MGKIVFTVLVCIFIIIISLIGEDINRFIGRDITGWVQVALSVVAIPLIVYELDAIREVGNRSPQISFGLANVNDLPISKLHTLQLKNNVNVSKGYAHFYIVLRNQGSAVAKNIKVEIEHTNPQQITYAPYIKVDEFSDNKPTFYAENNFNYIFRSPLDWGINIDDMEIFGFHLTTVIIEEYAEDSNGEKFAIRSQPAIGKVEIRCRVTVAGMKNPIEDTLTVNIVEK